MSGVAEDAVGLLDLRAGVGPWFASAGVEIEAGVVAGGDGGADAVAKRLRAEGHKIIHKGKRTVVYGFEKVVYSELK